MKQATLLTKTAMLGIFAALLVPSTASAGDLKAYGSSFCASEKNSDNITKRAWMLRAEESVSLTCPILRDQTGDDGLPRIYLEAYQASSSDSDLQCSLWWIDEDSNSGLIRGFSDNMTTGSTGNRQFAWNDINDFDADGSLSILLLSSGGEGTMAIHCNMEDNDKVYQYRVEENVFN